LKYFLPIESTKSGDIIATRKQKRIFSDEITSAPSESTQSRNDKRGGKRLEGPILRREGEESVGSKKEEIQTKGVSEEIADTQESNTSDSQQKRPKTVAFLVSPPAIAALSPPPPPPLVDQCHDAIDVERLCSSPLLSLSKEKLFKAFATSPIPVAPQESPFIQLARQFLVLSQDSSHRFTIFQVIHLSLSLLSLSILRHIFCCEFVLSEWRIEFCSMEPSKLISLFAALPNR
jgi:hypothetical protein